MVKIWRENNAPDFSCSELELSGIFLQNIKMKLKRKKKKKKITEIPSYFPYFFEKLKSSMQPNWQNFWNGQCSTNSRKSSNQKRRILYVYKYLFQI
jgi:hypothetical protein